jgi:hypothetical protein
LQNLYTFDLPAGFVPFQFRTGLGIILDNTGAGLGNPDPHSQNQPGYFLGMDPYLATGTYQAAGSAFYAALSDLPASGDHDFQDMGVRISVVPEPATYGAGLVIVVAGLTSWWTRRRTR